MADLKYIVEIALTEKGIGFSAKDALQAAQRAGSKLFKQVRFVEPPTGSLARIEVVMEEAYFPDLLHGIITNSGRMPTGGGHYEIKSVQLVSEEASLRKKLDDAERDYRRTQGELANLVGENRRLRSEAATVKKGVSSPLEGVLRYFDTLKLEPKRFLDADTDYDFARRVAYKQIPNTFDEYVSHVLGRKFEPQTLDRLLQFDERQSLAQLADFEGPYKLALEELAYAEKLRSGATDMPTSITGTVLKAIEDKNHQAAISAYEARRQELSETTELQRTLIGLKEKYDSFAESLEILNVAANELPVVFNGTENGFQAYFPFRTREVKTGIVEDLHREIGAYYSDGDVRIMPHDYVAFEVAKAEATIKPFLEEMPFTLKMSGFNRIRPLVFGRL